MYSSRSNPAGLIKIQVFNQIEICTVNLLMKPYGFDISFSLWRQRCKKILAEEKKKTEGERIQSLNALKLAKTIRHLWLILILED